jgi:hypothetical protein
VKNISASGMDITVERCPVLLFLLNHEHTFKDVLYSDASYVSLFLIFDYPSRPNHLHRKTMWFISA